MTMPVIDDTPQVEGLDPLDQHAAVITELARMTDGYKIAYGAEFEGSRAQASLMGRRAMLSRHQPRKWGADQRVCCPRCTSSPYYTGAVSWPCADYADVSAGLVDGLPAPEAA